MLRPSLEEVKALAKQYNTIPVFYEFSADNQTPLNIYRAFSQESRNSFILESVSNGAVGPLLVRWLFAEGRNPDHRKHR